MIGNRTGRSPWLFGLLAVLCMPAAVPAVEPLRIGHSAWVADAPTRLAAARGHFDSVEVPVTLIEHPSGRDSLAALRRQEVELALVAPTPFARALLEQSRGGPRDDDLMVLASVALPNRIHFILADAGRGIGRPSDLENRRIGLVPGSSAAFTWSRFVQSAQLDADAFEIVPGPPDRIRSLLLAGEVDAAVLWEPFFDSARRGLGDAAVIFSTRHLESMNWLLASRRAVIDARPDAIEQVLQAYRQAIDFLHLAPDEALQLDAELLGMEPGALERMTEGVIWSLTLDGPMLANLEHRLAWLRDGRPPDEPRLLPSRYLAAGPLARLEPGAVRIPEYLWRAP